MTFIPDRGRRLSNCGLVLQPEVQGGRHLLANRYDYSAISRASPAAPIDPILVARNMARRRPPFTSDVPRVYAENARLECLCGRLPNLK
jgi:hypothetical protein